ncbi:mitochondrial 54S ribosomal protein YmL8 [Martiniozyma asiatica (nom. inval.)]|nr:mitochondrial 54S ribosomal protein YmL8 [Martiniozyma asiatica]
MTLGRSAKKVNHLVKNLASSLIQHEHIITTPAKAKLTAAYVENLIVKTKKQEDIKQWTHVLHGKIFNPETNIPKLLKTYSQRYANRTHGFTRALKIENRFGDNAPQVILEMVDNESREMKFWITAKIVARLELQGEPIDNLTQKNIDDVIRFKENGKESFKDLVELCKKEFFQNESDLQGKSRMKNNTNGFNKQFYNFEMVSRSASKENA